MHRLTANFVLGFHGCDRSVADRLVAGEGFIASNNDYDWLGSGVYFWEANPQRGLDFAEELKHRGSGNITEPAVVGAVIDLGLCLDLTSRAGIKQAESAYKQLISVSGSANIKLPRNSPDLSQRNLDCAVIQTLHSMRAEAGQTPVDTVRGVFIEGTPVFPNSGIYEKTHIQIAVRNTDCIKGVFRTRPAFLS